MQNESICVARPRNVLTVEIQVLLGALAVTWSTASHGGLYVFSTIVRYREPRSRLMEALRVFVFSLMDQMPVVVWRGTLRGKWDGLQDVTFSQ